MSSKYANKNEMVKLESQKSFSMDEIKKYSFEALCFVADFCDAHRIQYFLHAGTLLGAVRHQGFIPWDDDVDICMVRSEYNRFITLFPRNNVTYQLQHFETVNNYMYPFAKVRDRRTIKHPSDENKRYLCEEGLSVDVFVIDGFPDNAVLRNVRFCEQVFLFKQIYLRFLNSAHIVGNPNLMQKVMTWFADRIGITSVAKKVNELAMRSPFGSSRYAGCSIALYRGKKELALTESYYGSVEMTFEGRSFHVPQGYKDVLKSLYGANYMTPPPENERVSTHESDIFWK